MDFSLLHVSAGWKKPVLLCARGNTVLDLDEE
jgi:hypothetical protein